MRTISLAVTTILAIVVVLATQASYHRIAEKANMLHTRCPENQIERDYIKIHYPADANGCAIIDFLHWTSK